MEIMKSELEIENTYIHEWVNYLCGVLEELNESFIASIKSNASEFQKNRIKNALASLNSHLDWVWGKQYKEHKNEERPNERPFEFNSEITDKGFRFRKHKL